MSGENPANLFNASFIGRVTDKADGEYTQDKEKKFLEDSF